MTESAPFAGYRRILLKISGEAAIGGDQVQPGETVTTRMPCSPNCTAARRV